MIYVIPHQIGKGSWVGWYEYIDIVGDYEILHFDNKEEIERKLLGDPPYTDVLISHLESIKDKLEVGDLLFVDASYFDSCALYDVFINDVTELSKKYKCKFIIIDGDNMKEYMDTPYFTYFSNRFFPEDSDYNFNYFRYRAPKYTAIKNFDEFYSPFRETHKPKKFNFISGVDKIFRLVTLKYIYDNGLKDDGYVGYSGFYKTYDDSEISDSLIKFRDETLPIILDIPIERSNHGAVNCEYPPWPITMTSYVSCIMESNVLSGGELHLSEKSWNPFISYNIPLILGSHGLNKYLQRLGFWLADDLFDVTDPIRNNADSMIRQYHKNLDILNSISLEDLHKYYCDNLQNMHNNYHLLMRQEFKFDKDNYKKFEL